MGYRLRAALLLAVLVVLGISASGAHATGKPARTIASANQLEAEVLGQLNAIRRAHRLTPLKLSRPLSSAADTHSHAMGKFGFFAHESRDGSEFWRRVKRWYGPGGYRSWAVGENLLWSTGSLNAAAALKLWMASPPHRKNILTPRWREVGLSAVSVASAPGVYGGRDVTIVTSDFGVRS
jgi:uncharacterized protein YkwD